MFARLGAESLGGDGAHGDQKGPALPTSWHDNYSHNGFLVPAFGLQNHQAGRGFAGFKSVPSSGCKIRRPGRCSEGPRVRDAKSSGEGEVRGVQKGTVLR